MVTLLKADIYDRNLWSSKLELGARFSLPAVPNAAQAGNFASLVKKSSI